MQIMPHKDAITRHDRSVLHDWAKLVGLDLSSLRHAGENVDEQEPFGRLCGTIWMIIHEWQIRRATEVSVRRLARYCSIDTWATLPLPLLYDELQLKRVVHCPLPRCY